MGLYDQWQEKMTDDKGFFRGQSEESPQIIGQMGRHTREGRGESEWNPNYLSTEINRSQEYGREPRSQFHGLVGQYNDYRMNRDLRKQADEFNLYDTYGRTATASDGGLKIDDERYGQHGEYNYDAFSDPDPNDPYDDSWAPAAMDNARDIIGKRSQQPNNLFDLVKGIF